MKDDLGVPKRYKETARQHIIELYRAWGKPEKAAEWKRKP
jgi:hypothetical protein